MPDEPTNQGTNEPTSRFLQHAGVPDDYQGMRLRDYKPVTPSQKEAVAAVRKFLDSGLRTHGSGLIFTGDIGSGKTHLAVGIMAELFARRLKLYQAGDEKTVAHYNKAKEYQASSELALFDAGFVQTLQYLARRKATFDPGRKTWNPGLATLDFLVLDDWGKERITPWVCEEIYSLLDYRYSHNLPTLITTNAHLKDLESAYNSQDMAAHVLGSCLMSRLREKNEVIYIKGPDGRKAKG